MPILTTRSRATLARVLAWDRRRVARAEARGKDGTVYKARQNLAEACLDLPTENWPEDVRELYQALLEVTRTPSYRPPVLTDGMLGREERAPLTRIERADHRHAASEIGVLAKLVAVSPVLWAEEP